MKNTKYQQVRYQIILKGITKQGYGNCVLTPESLVVYKNMIMTMFRDLNCNGSRLEQGGLKDLLTKIVQVLKQQNKQISMSYLLKKLSLFHGFIYNLARRRRKLLSVDLTVFREYTIIFEKCQHQNQKWINKQKDKGALKQIFQKILTPYALYVRKLMTHFVVYSDIINGKFNQQPKHYLWKIANWSNILGSIVVELNRIGKYFKQDFIGFQVLLIYVISLDLSIFYDLIQSQIEREVDRVKEINLSEANSFSEQDDINSKTYKKQNQFQNEEVKLLIQQSSKIKQTLNCIFGCQQLRLWRKYFSKSEYYNYQMSQSSEDSNQIWLQTIKQNQKINRDRDRQTVYKNINIQNKNAKFTKTENQAEYEKQSQLELFSQNIQGISQLDWSLTFKNQITKALPIKKARLMHLNSYKERRNEIGSIKQQKK